MATQLLLGNLSHSFLDSKTRQTFEQKVVKLNLATKEKREISIRPLMLGELDKMVQVCFKSVSSRGAAININIVHATAKTLIQRYPDIVAILILMLQV